MRCFVLERVRGIEPLSPVWKTGVIPVYDTRLFFISVYSIIDLSKMSTSYLMYESQPHYHQPFFVDFGLFNSYQLHHVCGLWLRQVPLHHRGQTRQRKNPPPLCAFWWFYRGDTSNAIFPSQNKKS